MSLGTVFKESEKEGRLHSIFFHWLKHVHVLLYPDCLFPKMVCPAKVTWKKTETEREWKCESESFQYWPGVYPNRHARPTARGSTCLRLFGCCGIPDPSLYKACSCRIWQKGKKSRACTHTSEMNRWSEEHRLVAQWNVSDLICPGSLQI